MENQEMTAYCTKWTLPLCTVMTLAAGLPANVEAEVVAEKVKEIEGIQYKFIKMIDKKGNAREAVYDSKGNRIRAKQLLTVKAPKLDPKLRKRMATLRGTDKTIKVNISLYADLPLDVTEEAESGGMEILDGISVRQTINGKAVSKAELERNTLKLEKTMRNQGEKLNQLRISTIQEWAKRHGLQDKKGVKQALAGGYSSVTVELNYDELERLLAKDDSNVAGYEMYEKPSDDIAEAMVDTSISSSALPYGSTRGDDIGIYMTESGCANEWRITNYDRLAGSETDHSRNVGAIIRAVSPDSFLYCRGSAVLPLNSDLDGVGGHDPIYIVTRSNSSNDSTSYNTLDRDWDNFVYNKNVATFNSGGNTGLGTGNVRSPGKGLNILTVGNYNDATDTIHNRSPYVDPNTGNDKPELVAPGTNITAGGFTKTGTSMSTPHAAAFAADMMSSSTYLKHRPYLVYAKMLSGATDAITGGYNKVGLGGIDFASAHWSGYWQYYTGGNSSFGYFDSMDGSSDGYITKKIYISSSWDSARVSIAWLNRGTYTYDHRLASHPIGMDLDLRVYNPYGNYVGGSYSWDNSFEKVNFKPTVTGYYTFKINRYANRDTGSSLRLGMYVNYYN
jgi:hypothetical protein